MEVESVEGGTTLSPEQAAKLRANVAPAGFFERIKELVNAIAPRKI